MEKLRFLCLMALVAFMSCNDGLSIEEPLVDRSEKTDTIYYVSYSLKSTGTIDTSSVVVYADSSSVKQKERIMSGDWQKQFKAKPGFPLFISIKGSVVDGVVDLEVAVTDSLNYSIRKQSKNNSQGKKTKTFDFTFEQNL